jgi:hypothetical protein
MLLGVIVIVNYHSARPRSPPLLAVLNVHTHHVSG